MSDMARAASVRRTIALGALVAGPIAVTVAGLVQVTTGDSGAEELRNVAASPHRFYAGGLLFALGLGLIAVGIGQVYRLVDRKGSVWATVGGTAIQVGGMLAAAAIFMYTAAVYVAADRSLDRAAMAKWDHLAGNSAATGWPFMGFIAFSAGLIVLSIGLLRARTVAIWQPILVIVGSLLVFFVQPDNSLLGTLVGLPLVVGLLSLAWSVNRLPSGSAPAIDLTGADVPFPRTAAETPAEQHTTS